MTILLSSSNSPNPKIIPETSQELPRIVPASTSTSWKFRVSMDQGKIKIKLPKLPEKIKRKKETDADKKMKEEKGKIDFIRPRMVFSVKKMTSVISGVFIRKKTLRCKNRDQRDDSTEISEADETLAIKHKQNSIQKRESFWESARIRLKILNLGQRLKTRRRRSLSEGMGEVELCKKRILMGERCKPMNKSGALQYDGDGILLPEP